MRSPRPRVASPRETRPHGGMCGAPWLTNENVVVTSLRTQYGAESSTSLAANEQSPRHHTGDDEQQYANNDDHQQMPCMCPHRPPFSTQCTTGLPRYRADARPSSGDLPIRPCSFGSLESREDGPDAGCGIAPGGVPGATVRLETAPGSCNAPPTVRPHSGLLRRGGSPWGASGSAPKVARGERFECRSVLRRCRFGPQIEPWGRPNSIIAADQPCPKAPQLTEPVWAPEATPQNSTSSPARTPRSGCQSLVRFHSATGSR